MLFLRLLRSGRIMTGVPGWTSSGPLLEFQLKVDKKYGSSLCTGGSGSWMEDAIKKLSWVKEKEDILDLRRKLHTGSETITMLAIAAMR